MEVISIFSVLGWSKFILHKNPELHRLSVFYAMSLIITVLFFAGIFQLLYPVTIAFFFIGLIFFLNSLKDFYLLKKIKGSFHFALDSEWFEFIAVFTLGLLWYLWTSKSFVFGWDEFFWGQFTKSIYLEKALYTALSPVLESHVRYPPGIPLWQYFFTFSYEFKENAMFLANGLISIMGLVFFLNLKQKSKLEVGLKIYLYLYLLGAMATGLCTLLVDYLMGICLGLGFIIINQFNIKKNIMWILPVIWLFFLIKQTGVVLSVLLAFTVVLVNFNYFFKERTYIKYFKLILILAAPLVPFLLWSFHLSKGPDTSYLSAESILSIETLNKIVNNWQQIRLVLISFFKGLSSVSIRENYLYYDSEPYRGLIRDSILFWIALFYLVIRFFSKNSLKEVKKKQLLFHLGFFTTLSAWLFIHLLSYMLINPDREGVQLASFARYMSTVVIAYGIYSFSHINLTTLETMHRTKTFIIFLLIGLSLALPINPKIFITRIEKSPPGQVTNELLDKLEPTFLNVQKVIPLNSKIWFICQNSSGMEAMITRFHISPRKMNTWYWSLGKKYYDGDLWTNDLSTESFKKMILTESADFLVVYKTDENFYEKYKELFSIGSKVANHTVFKINKNQESPYLFEQVNIN